MSDPVVYILFAAAVSGSLGFFAACLMASRRIREIERQTWQEGYDRCNRDHAHKLRI